MVRVSIRSLSLIALARKVNTLIITVARSHCLRSPKTFPANNLFRNQFKKTLSPNHAVKNVDYPGFEKAPSGNHRRGRRPGKLQDVFPAAARGKLHEPDAQDRGRHQEERKLARGEAATGGQDRDDGRVSEERHEGHGDFQEGDIEKETKLGEEKNLINLFPKFYGGQLTRNEENPDEADDDAILLMENVKVLGYDTMDRKMGLDLDHAKLAITELARYHGLGVALRTHKPDLFEEVRRNTSEIPFEITPDEYSEIMDHTIKLISQDPRICKYVDRIKATFEGCTSWWDSFQEFVSVEPWVSINHGDFWVNNIMFRHDKNGISGIKFVDFQIARVCSPIYDIPYFLGGSTSSYVLEKHFDDLLDTYYNRFIEVLNKTNCDSSLFTRASFDEQLKKIAYRTIIYYIVAIKFFTLEVSEDLNMNDIKSSVMLSGASKVFLDRVWYFLKKYLDKGWL